ncbi:MAG: response regulator [Candidatus Omnitrophica bacterium]|nr:response regulator [Candidatus Omnitrophota bacterium]
MKKILYIEDDLRQASLLQNRIEANGYIFLYAKDGHQGLEKVSRDKPDLVILDVLMSKIDGFDVCKSLKQQPETSHIPVVVLTGLKFEYIKERFEEAGADACLNKPYDSGQLIAKIQELLGEEIS